MPRDVIDSLKEWGGVKRQKKKNTLLAGCDWGRVLDGILAGGLKGAEERPNLAALFNLESYKAHSQNFYRIAWFAERGKKVAARSAKHTHYTMAVCKLILSEGDEAECEMVVAGYEVPRVSFPKWVLDAKALKVGDKFIWTMRDADHISTDDIDTEVGVTEPQLNQADLDRLKQLRNDAMLERANGKEEWVEYTGPGQ